MRSAIPKYPVAALAVILTLCIGCSDKPNSSDGGRDVAASSSDTSALDTGAQDATDTAAKEDTARRDTTVDLPPEITPSEAFDLVDPFVGSGGQGYGYAALTPAAQMPNGMVKLGPDTSKGSLVVPQHHFSGYHHGDTDIRGFSHVRLIGTGATAFGNIRWSPVDKVDDNEPWKSWVPMDKSSETAEPGYYAVRIEKPAAIAKMASSLHGGMQHYMPEDKKEFVLTLDATSTIEDNQGVTAEVEIASGNAFRVEGVVHHTGDFATRSQPLDIHFSTTIEPAPAEHSVWDASGVDQMASKASGKQAGAVLRFENLQKPVVVRTGISYVDRKQAREHRKSELDGQSMMEVRSAAKEAWKKKLGRIRIRADKETDEAAMFYTALYNLWRMPTRFDGSDGRYFGFDGKVHESKDFDYYTDLSLWDSFRTAHPLLVLVDPELQRNCLKSLIAMGEQGGYIPRWPAGASYTGSMLGSSADIVFAGSKLKGIDGVDYGRAFDLLEKSADPSMKGPNYHGREDVLAYKKHNYVPAETEESVSKTVEYAWADWALANLARELGRTAAASKYEKRSKYWKNLYDSKTGFLRPKDENGSFVDPFDTEQLGGRSGPFTEGNAWHWRFYVLHSPKDLVDAFGGAEQFGKPISTFFEESAIAESAPLKTILPDKRYWHGNEHDLHSAYLFHFTDTPGRVAHWVRRIQKKAYALEPGGIPGNDDGGTLTSWYVFSALGLYPVAGGHRYLLGAPLFDAARIVRPDGKSATIRAPGADLESDVVDSVELDGQPVDDPYVAHGDLLGSTLEFDLATNER